MALWRGAEDAANCLLRLKSHAALVAPGADKNTLDERRQQARCASDCAHAFATRVRAQCLVFPLTRFPVLCPCCCSPDQITREVDEYEMQQLLDYGGGEDAGSAFFAAGSQGGDRRVQ